MTKLSSKEFWEFMRKNGGLLSRTVRSIKKELGIDISRQALDCRARGNPTKMKQIEEETIDIAEETVHDIMRKGEEKNRLKAAQFYLKSKGKDRGYFEKQVLAGDEDAPLFLPVEVSVSEITKTKKSKNGDKK